MHSVLGVFTQNTFCNWLIDRNIHSTAFRDSSERDRRYFVIVSCKSRKTFRHSHVARFRGPFCLLSAMKRRVFYKGILNHCYQRTADRGVLFYTYSDHLVFFTQYCIMARKYGIQVLAVCQMPDHVHDSVIANRKQDLEMFKQYTNSGFVRKRSEQYGLTGSVFDCSFGSVPKVGDKKARTNLIYVGNNPVERRLVSKAEEYRWNYLAYAASDHPFSEKLVIRDARWPLLKAIKEVKAQYDACKPLNYAQLQRIFQPLDRKESLQLTDFIITTYNVIDYASAIRFFDTYDRMLIALHATTGSEYDLNEVFIGKSDAPYNKMTSILLRERLVRDIHEILRLSVDEKYGLFLLLRRETEAPAEQIAAFLHMPLKKVSNGND